MDASRSYGGPLSVALALAEEQAKQNQEVTIVGLSNNEYQETTFGGSSLKVKLFNVKRFTPGKKFSKLFSLKGAIWIWRNQDNFDVIHMHFSRDVFQTLVGLGLRAKKNKLALQPHGMLTNLVAKEKLLQFAYDWLLTNRVIRKAALVLALQETEKAALIQNFNPKTIQTLPNGVAFTGIAKSLIRDPKLVVFVSRLHEQKNPLLFVQAALKMIETGSELHFVIAGPDGGQRDLVQKAIDQADTQQLRYIGALQNHEVRELLGQACLLVLPSIDDQFPMVVLEALSSGLQVAVSKSCGLAGVIQANDLGVVFNSSLVELTKSIGSATTSPRNPEVIISQARQLFDISLIVEKLDLIYRNSPSASDGPKK
jgi:glycosyltransferase involved in cell wall biosynthesis